MRSVIDFFKRSHALNPRLFYIEMASAVSVLIASFMLSINAADPDMRWIYPFFFFGTACGLYTNYKRNLAFPLVLMTVFFFNNIYGNGVAWGWW